MSSKDDMFADSIFSHRKRMETISEIVEGEIYLSSLLAATQAGDTLKGRGITHVISLLKEPFNRSSTVEYMVIGEDDSADTDLKKYFASINAFIDDAITNGGAVLLHCHSGISRSATVAIAYLMYSKQMSALKAYELVKEKRSSINPNLGFIRQLQEYDEHLRTERNNDNPSSPPNAGSTAESTPFLVHYLRTSIPGFTQNISDDQLATTAQRCEYNYIQVLASLRTLATAPTAC